MTAFCHPLYTESRKDLRMVILLLGALMIILGNSFGWNDNMILCLIGLIAGIFLLKIGSRILSFALIVFCVIGFFALVLIG